MDKPSRVSFTNEDGEQDSLTITSEAAFQEIVMVLEHGPGWAEEAWDSIEEDTRTFIMKMFKHLVDPEKQ